MTQYVINIGAIPNDGTGDPLRTAFNETNLNFNQVFAAGPVLSNVRIANNSILTTTTNGNLILAPNGTGVVQSNVHIVPNTGNLRNLGSALQRWNTVYTQYVDVSGPTTFGQLTVTGNLTVNGNIIQIGNLVTDAKTIQLANTAGTANAANGSGITVGANDNIATFLYTSGANRWNTNIGLQVAGLANVASLSVNQTANDWFIGGNSIRAPSGANWTSNPEFLDEYITSANNGYIDVQSILSGNTAAALHLEHGLAQIIANSGTSQIWSFDSNGNITLPGNTSSINYANGNPYGGSSYGNANVATLLAAFGSNTISTAGNITSNGVANVNVLRVNQTANAWFIAGNTITAPSGATWNSNAISKDEYITSALDGYINLTSRYANGNTASQVHLEHGLAQIVVDNGSEYIWAFDNTGNLTLPSNGSLNINGGDIVQSAGNDLRVIANNDNIAGSSLLMSPGDTLTRLQQWSGQDSNTFTAADWTTGTYTTEGGGSIGAVQFTNAANIINFVNSLNGTGQIFFSVNGGPQLVYDGASSGDGAITFYTPTLPETDPTTVTTFDYYYSYKSGFEIDYDSRELNIYANDADINLETTGQRDIGLNSDRDMTMYGNGDVSITNYSSTNGVYITSNADVASKQWEFDETGNLILPAGGVVYETGIPGGTLTGSTIALKPQGGIDADQQLLVYPTAANVDANHLHLTSGNLYNTELFLGNDDLYVKLANTGNVVINSNDNLGNIAQWTFGANGNLTVPGGIVGSGASPAPYLSGFSSVSAITLSASGNVVATGNVTGGNLITSGSGGDITMSGGNITGANVISAIGNISGNNISIVGEVGANTINATGEITSFANIVVAPGGFFQGDGSQLSNVATQVNSSWTLTAGTNTVSLTVPLNGTYSMWVRGNIPNGIVVWTATVTVTNNNVPAIGQQFAWYYPAPGNALVLTSIPAQIIGTANTISNSTPAVGTTTNVFEFTIDNNSGNSAVVNYGYTKIG
jgi:hypothetical protein